MGYTVITFAHKGVFAPKQLPSAVAEWRLKIPECARFIYHTVFLKILKDYAKDC